jgi:hypothetical protein
VSVAFPRLQVAASSLPGMLKASWTGQSEQMGHVANMSLLRKLNCKSTMPSRCRQQFDGVLMMATSLVPPG